MDLAKISNQELLLRLENLAKTERKNHSLGSLSLTQLTQVQKCLNEEKKAGAPIDLPKTLEILEKIENKSNQETQKLLASEFNQAIQMHEVLKSQKDSSVRLEITFSEEQMSLLTEARELLSHALPEATWAEVITFLAKKQIEKVRGKDKQSVSASKDTSSIAADMPLTAKLPKTERATTSTQGFFIKQKRKYIGITTKRELYKIANNCCEYRDPVSGKKCETRYQLQTDHRTPLVRGGGHGQENLRLLCRTHNLLAARQWGL